MPRSSLTASAEGTQQARKALKRLSLTQKALVDERGVASWSTVNNFFNGKPVQREIFMTICEELDLKWQDIVMPFSEDQETQQLTPLDQLWQQLKALGSITEQMGLVVVKEKTLSWGTEIPSRYEKSVNLGNYIQFEVNFETPGYLILIQKDTSGQIWCFCPSCFAPQSKLETGKTSLPQEGSPITSFPLEGTPGKEQVLAVLTQKEPNLQWLPQGNDNPLELEEFHLMQLIEFVNQSEDSQVLYTEYTVN